MCLACGVLGETGPELVKMLLDSLADPNATADLGNEYLNMCEPNCLTEVSLLSDVQKKLFFSILNASFKLCFIVLCFVVLNKFLIQKNRINPYSYYATWFSFLKLLSLCLKL